MKSSIFSNSIFNTISTETNISSYNSNIKNVFGIFLKEDIKLIREYQKLFENMNFKYSGEDFLSKAENNAFNKKLLTAYGFSETTESEFINAEYNTVVGFETIDNSENNIYKSGFSFFNGEQKITANFVFEPQNISFFDNLNKNLFLNFEFEDFWLVDFSITKDLFCYFKILHDKKYYLCYSHLGLIFNTESVTFDSLDCFYMIPIGDTYLGKFFNVKPNEIVLFNETTKSLNKITFGKKYFFESNANLFFVENYDSEELNSICLVKNVQIEHLFLYDLVSLYGLDDFIDSKGNKKISSKNFHYPAYLFKNRFGSNLNGMLNYFDFEEQKSYKVRYADNFLSVYDNFYYKGDKGLFKIKVNSDTPKIDFGTSVQYKISLYKFTSGSFKELRTVEVNTAGTNLFFCNLNIKINGLSTLKVNSEINFNVYDDYIVSFEEQEKNIDNDFIDNFSGFEEQLRENSFMNSFGNLKSDINYSFETNSVKTNSFYFEKYGKINKLESLTFSLEAIKKMVTKLKHKDFYFNFDVEQKTIVLKPKIEEKNILTLNRHFFRLNFSD